MGLYGEGRRGDMLLTLLRRLKQILLAHHVPPRAEMIGKRMVRDSKVWRRHWVSCMRIQAASKGLYVRSISGEEVRGDRHLCQDRTARGECLNGEGWP